MSEPKNGKQIVVDPHGLLAAGDVVVPEDADERGDDEDERRGPPPCRARRPRLGSAAVQVIAPVEEDPVDGGGADDLALREGKADRVEDERLRLRPPIPPWKEISSSKAQPSSRSGS